MFNDFDGDAAHLAMRLKAEAEDDLSTPRWRAHPLVKYGLAILVIGLLIWIIK